eukprot:1725527-Ditylum_brightwellii.AAC.1
MHNLCLALLEQHQFYILTIYTKKEPLCFRYAQSPYFVNKKESLIFCYAQSPYFVNKKEVLCFCCAQLFLLGTITLFCQQEGNAVFLLVERLHTAAVGPDPHTYTYQDSHREAWKPPTGSA